MSNPSHETKVAKVKDWLGSAQTEAAHISQVCFEHSIYDMKSLAEYLGIDLVFREVPELPKLCGYLDQSDKPYIFINSIHHPLHQEFTIAHEIAHHVLHKSKQDSWDNPKENYQAHVFAWILINSIRKEDVPFPMLDHNFLSDNSYRYPAEGIKRYPLLTASIPFDVLIQTPFLDEVIADIENLSENGEGSWEKT